MVTMPYVTGMLVFAVSDSVEAAAITAFIAGVFSVLNTLLNAHNAAKLSKIDKRQRRVLSLIGERDQDKSLLDSTTEPGQNDNDNRRTRRNKRK